MTEFELRIILLGHPELISIYEWYHKEPYEKHKYNWVVASDFLKERFGETNGKLNNDLHFLWMKINGVKWP